METSSVRSDPYLAATALARTVYALRLHPSWPACPRSVSHPHTCYIFPREPVVTAVLRRGRRAPHRQFPPCALERIEHS